MWSRNILITHSSGKKTTYTVITLFQKKLSAFYTTMMQILRDDWLAQFEETKNVIIVENVPVTIICDDKILIDNILLYYNDIPTLLH